MKTSDDYLKSPINYTGNKFRILDQMFPYFPKKCNTMIDMFCGGATVGLNVDYKNIIFIDSDRHVISLLRYLSKITFVKFVEKIDKVTQEYDLTCSYLRKISKAGEGNYNKNNGLKHLNEKGYYKLRKDFNALSNKFSDKANLYLYVLMAYGFNNDLRFTKDGKFNIPVGKTDFNKNNAEKVRLFIERIKDKNVKFICASFTNKSITKYIEQSDFIYMDPPYLITDAVYNETPTWTNENEHDLLDFVENLISQNKFFVLSNCISRDNIKNEPLYYWIKKMKNSVKQINLDYDYHTCSYNKKLRNSKDQEVIIIPKRKKHV